ncbi:hypothetical protein H9X85_00770 [Anaerotignum lactatifermentans]|uniref:DUF2178 domain-containing protein n=1 Tax=Anaerotignum lactatifermentans TaxID=160404 RepID=A0ABS2G7E0_9FIRM|nr:hypothetical protein [Anaerotignum lactatifermentans]MBM6828159.1 hypothetical protein [Anaerotignum lactatifermentans]MBM6876678.1 hypothetical protein [Anaerotignum lactatifermentans]MBM6949742.1 hypothetical protein [Anaerotignum lactatifermentans]
MNYKRKLKWSILFGILWIALGILAVCCAVFRIPSSGGGYPFSYLCGTGGSLFAIGGLSILRSLRLMRNEELCRKEEIRLYDERNVYIQKQISSLHSTLSLALLYGATLWAAICRQDLLLPFIFLMIADVALLLVTTAVFRMKNSC